MHFCEGELSLYLCFFFIMIQLVKVVGVVPHYLLSGPTVFVATLYWL